MHDVCVSVVTPHLDNFILESEVPYLCTYMCTMCKIILFLRDDPMACMSVLRTVVDQ